MLTGGFGYAYMNTAELLDTAFELYKKTFWRQMVRVMILGIPAILAFSAYIAAAVFILGVTNSGGASGLSMSAGILAFFFILMYLVWAAASAAGNISLTRQAFYGSPISLDTMFNDIKSNFFRVFSALSAVFLAVLPFLAAAIYIVIYAARYIQLLRASSAFLIFISVVALFAAALIALIFQTLTSNAVHAAAFEKKYFFAAVIRSCVIIKGDAVKIFGTYIIWQMITAIVSYSALIALYLAAGFVNGALGWVSDYYLPGLYPAMVISNMVSVWISVVLSPLSGILPSSVYFNQMIKKEGLDIKIKLEMLGGRA